MSSMKIILASACLTIAFQETYGHGRMLDPASRSSAWRIGFGTPKNYNDNEVFCGGATLSINGNCGACGDNHANKQPRSNENGGKYGPGKIVKTYNQAQRLTVEIELTANHKGHFEFAVCPLNRPNDIETEECFGMYPVQFVASGTYNFQVPPAKDQNRSEIFKIDVILPKNPSCKHCSFRWHYRGGNNSGVCEDGASRDGCGPQETFRNCADISIS